MEYLKCKVADKYPKHRIRGWHSARTSESRSRRESRRETDDAYLDYIV